MNISAINCTPIKPQVITFKSNADFSEKDYEEIEKMADDIQTKYVDSSTIKNPLAIVATIGIAAALGFFGGKRVAGPVKEFTNKFLSNPQKPIDITNPNCEKYFEKPLKNFSKKIRETATSLQEKEGVRFHGFKKTVGIILEKVEESSRSIYKKITNMGITDNLSYAEKGAKKFNNIAGAGGVFDFVPNFFNNFLFIVIAQIIKSNIVKSGQVSNII